MTPDTEPHDPAEPRDRVDADHSVAGDHVDAGDHPAGDFSLAGDHTEAGGRSVAEPANPPVPGDGAAASRIRVLVCDDQAIVRDGLVTVLSLLDDVTVVGQAADGAEAVRLAAEAHPDVVLMDLRMPVLDGTAATAAIVAAHPATAVLVLTTYADDASIVGALRAGARGYLTKDAGRTEVATAIRSVARGQATFAPEVGALLIDSMIGAPTAARTAAADGRPGVPTPAALRIRFPLLTQREAEVLALVGDGLSNGEIAARMFVSVATVKTHINALFAKLAVRDRAQAIALVRT